MAFESMARWLAGLFALGACLVGQAGALVIDDFTQGEITIPGAVADVIQQSLDPAHTAGGERRVKVTNTGDLVSIIAEEGLRYTASAGAYGFELIYGDEQPLGIELSQGGFDRLVLKFSDSSDPAARLDYVRVTGAPSEVTLQKSFARALFNLGEYGSLEFPLAGLSTVDRISIDFNRALSSAGFVLEEVFLSGPPVTGDYNRDGSVDLLDYEEWRRLYGGISSNGSTVSGLFTADGNQDGYVDGADYTIWRDSLPGPVPPFALPAPEPASPILVVALGLWVSGRTRAEWGS